MPRAVHAILVACTPRTGGRARTRQEIMQRTKKAARPKSRKTESSRRTGTKVKAVRRRRSGTEGRPKMINRRTLLGTAGVGAGAALAGGSLALPRLLGGEAKAQPLSLSKALPQGVRDSATLEALPGKKPLIKLA